MLTPSPLPKGLRAPLRLCSGHRAFSLHSPSPMLGRMSLGGETGDSPSEESSSSLIADKMLVLAGDPVGENPVRVFPDTGLLQGDTAVSQQALVMLQHLPGRGAPCSPVPTTGPLASVTLMGL